MSRSAEAYRRAPQLCSQADALVFAKHKFIRVFLQLTTILERAKQTQHFPCSHARARLKELLSTAELLLQEYRNCSVLTALANHVRTGLHVEQFRGPNSSTNRAFNARRQSGEPGARCTAVHSCKRPAPRAFEAQQRRFSSRKLKPASGRDCNARGWTTGSPTGKPTSPSHGVANSRK